MQRTGSPKVSSKKRPLQQESRAKTGAAIRLKNSGKETGESIESEAPGSILRPRKWRSAYIVIPVALAFIASINTLWNGYASDDARQVVESASIRQLSNIPRAFTTSVWAFAATDIMFTVDSYYRPLFNVLFTINYALFGTAAWGWHLVNVLVHSAVTLLLFLVFSELTERRWLSLVAAILFAVHPVHAESVAWISGVTDPLMSLFLLPAFYFYVRYRRTGSRNSLAGALAFYLGALLSKETAIALVPIVGYCEIFYLNGSMAFSRRMTRAFMIAGLFLVPTAIYFVMRYNVLAGLLSGSGPHYPLSMALATIPLAIVKYLKLMLIPTGYSYQHFTMLVPSLTSLEFLVPLAIVAAIVVGIWFARSRNLSFACAWFILTLAPALAALRQFDPEYLIQERYLYVPSMGLCLAMALGVERLASIRRLAPYGPAVAAGVTAVAVIVGGAAYMKSNHFWYDTLSVFRNCVAVEPTSSRARTSLARTYFDLGRLREAETEARKALELDPQSASGFLNLSFFAHMGGKLDKSIEYLENATTAITPGPMTRYNLATIYLNLGMLYERRKDFDKAEQSMLKSLEIWPRSVGWYHTGEFYFNRSRFPEALEMFDKALNAAPSWFAPVHIKLGFTYEGLKDFAKARAEFEKYLELAPPDAPDRNDVKTHLGLLDRQ